MVFSPNIGVCGMLGLLGSNNRPEDPERAPTSSMAGYRPAKVDSVPIANAGDTAENLWIARPMSGRMAQSEKTAG
jgi:hypothetical protein